ncbi:MAG: phage holin family protein [Gudongella sp.]|jgi:uncharacterized membrane protein YvlD (DUF360 family)|nr:phage holin family protein [Gudongella sp.]
MRRKGLFSLIIRVLTTAIVLGIAAFFTPGFLITGGFGNLIAAAIFIGLFSWGAKTILGIRLSPFGAGASGYLITAMALYLAKYIVPGFTISVTGALIGALVLGIVDKVIPGRRFK